VPTAGVKTTDSTVAHRVQPGAVFDAVTALKRKCAQSGVFDAQSFSQCGAHLHLEGVQENAEHFDTNSSWAWFLESSRTKKYYILVAACAAVVSALGRSEQKIHEDQNIDDFHPSSNLDVYICSVSVEICRGQNSLVANHGGICASKKPRTISVHPFSYFCALKG